MEGRALGKTGLIVSALGYGAGAVGGLLVRGEPAEQRRAIVRALEAGVTYFDTAAGYGDGRSEENLGRVLRDLNAWDRVVVGTKLRMSTEDLADPAAAIRRSCEASLRRLGRDTVDLMQVHNRVTPSDENGAVSLDRMRGEVAEGMRALVQAGLARHVGFNGLGDAASLAALARSGQYATVQSYFNALNPSAGHAGASGGGQDFAGLIDVAAGVGLGAIAIRVLAAGAISGQTERHRNAGDPGAPPAAGADYERDLARARRLAPLVEEWGLESPLELALRFALAKPGVSTALVGISDADQLEAALRWAGRGPLPPDAVDRVVDLARGEA